ncbi:MAG: alpha/beta hydrolase [Gammaproteobacteria bacterium]|nr:alpha/beta hydrolase [Gammaproteobacteria bacterium]MBT8443134.1 alpha/beta hydrolase [Gammaproteobacteria bacterium]
MRIATRAVLLAGFSVGHIGSADTHSRAAGIDLLQATPAEFCQQAQRVVSRTDVVGKVTMHADFYDFVKSKTSIDPLSLHGFVWADSNGNAVAISCKLKSADHLNAAFGDGAAGPDGLCQDMNRASLRQVQRTVPDLADRQVIFDEQENVFSDEDPPSTGRIWLEPFELTYADAAGDLHVRSKGFRVDWTDPRFAMLDARVRGVHYCHLIAPAHLRAVLAGDADPGATAGRAVYPEVAPPAAEAPAADTLRYSTITGSDGVPLNAVEAGPKDAPGILFLHGFSQTYLSFDAQFRDAELANDFHLVAFDLRGHGNSGKPWDPEAYSSRQFADDVNAVLRATGLRQPVVVGWSFGGLVAMHYVRHYGADRIRALNLVGTTGRLYDIPVPATGASRPAMDPAWIRLTLSDSIADNLQATARAVEMLTARPMSDEWTERTRSAAMTMPVYAKRAIGAAPGSNADLAESIRVPVLFSAGALDPIAPLADTLATSTMLPGTRVSVFPESGHSPFAEEPARFNRELAEFARVTP